MGGYLPGTERERRDMLAALGLSSADELFAALPEGVRLKGLSLPEGLSQQGVERRVRALAAENTVYPTILRRGRGAALHSRHRERGRFPRGICDRIYALSAGDQSGRFAVHL